MRSRVLRSTTSRLAVVLLIAAVSTACAAKGLRNQLRVGALGANQAAIDLSQTESDLYASRLYPQATHDTLVEAKLKVLHSARAFERAVAQWPAGEETLPVAVEQARRAVLVALDDLEKVIPQIEVVRRPLDAALKALRDALATQISQHLQPVPPLRPAELPPLQPGLLSILAIAQLVTKMLLDGRLNPARWIAFLRKEGASDEEIAASDLAVSAEIARVETTEKPAASGN